MYVFPISNPPKIHITYYDQGLVKGAILCFRNLNFYFQHGESTSTSSQLTSPASQKSKDLNKVPLLLQDLAHTAYPNAAKPDAAKPNVT